MSAANGHAHENGGPMTGPPSCLSNIYQPLSTQRNGLRNW